MKRSLLSRAGGLALALAALGSGCGGEKNVSTTAGSKASASSTTEAKPAQSSSAAPSGSTSASAVASASTAPEAGRPEEMNVLVLSIDALRADRMEWAGHNPEVLPTLNAFEKTSVSYTHFYSISSFTAQTLGGFLGCRYPSELKRNGNFFAVYPQEELLFPELLQKAGIRTMSAHGHFYFWKEKAGFYQGFDIYDILPGVKKNNTTDESITSPAHTEVILKHLSDTANTKGRFFAWYHLLDAHDQYKGHPEGKSFGKGAANMYDGELYFVDMHIKKILDYVDSQEWGKRTVVIITSDHGEAFGEHGMYRHGFELWENLIHVPLMIRAPGGKPRRIDATRSMIDLCPTILDTFHVEPDPAFHGTSLWPEIEGGEATSRDVIADLARTSDNDRRRVFIRGDFKLIELGDADGYQLFNIKDDPEEKNDLARKNPDKLDELKKGLKDAGVKDICPSGGKLKLKKKNRPC
ncbi:MAG: sulfatase [Polyangiaceae bacterium]